MKDDVTYSKVCKSCGTEKIYSDKYHWQRACKDDKVCQKCMLIERNKTRNYAKRELNTNWKGFNEIPYNWFSKYFKRSARKRKGSITLEEVYNLWISQNKRCALSGILIGFYDTCEGRGHSCSIDRIDSSKEYDLDNIQLVHKDVNLMKNYFNNEYFINMCKLITKNIDDMSQEQINNL